MNPRYPSHNGHNVDPCSQYYGHPQYPPNTRFPVSPQSQNAPFATEEKEPYHNYQTTHRQEYNYEVLHDDREVYTRNKTSQDSPDSVEQTTCNSQKPEIDNGNSEKTDKITRKTSTEANEIELDRESLEDEPEKTLKELDENLKQEIIESEPENNALDVFEDPGQSKPHKGRAVDSFHFILRE